MASGFVQSFGKIVRELRKRQGISQEEFADRAGLHRTHISLIERGKREARLETIEQIAQALGVQPSELMPVVKIKRVRLLDHKTD